jgi:hypothetical protein
LPVSSRLLSDDRIEGQPIWIFGTNTLTQLRIRRRIIMCGDHPPLRFVAQHTRDGLGCYEPR